MYFATKGKRGKEKEKKKKKIQSHSPENKNLQISSLLLRNSVLLRREGNDTRKSQKPFGKEV